MAAPPGWRTCSCSRGRARAGRESGTSHPSLAAEGEVFPFGEVAGRRVEVASGRCRHMVEQGDCITRGGAFGQFFCRGGIKASEREESQMTRSHVGAQPRVQSGGEALTGPASPFYTCAAANQHAADDCPQVASGFSSSGELPDGSFMPRTRAELVRDEITCFSADGGRKVS